MLKIRTDLMREWKQETEADGIRFSFPAPKDAKGRIPCGFVFTNDSAADWTGWYGLELAVEGPASEEPAQLSITVEFFSREPLSLTVPLLLSDGKAHVELPFSLFPLEQAKENDWDAVTAVRLLFHPSDLRVTQCAAKRRQGLFLHMPENRENALFMRAQSTTARPGPCLSARSRSFRAGNPCRRSLRGKRLRRRMGAAKRSPPAFRH